MKSSDPYKSIDDNNQETNENIVSEELNLAEYAHKKTLIFFNSFEESDQYFRQKMAQMSPEERLLQLKVIRANSKRFLQKSTHTKPFGLTLRVELGYLKN